MSLLDSLGQLSPEVYNLLISVVSLVAIFFIYKLLSRFVARALFCAYA
jgi:hypothetical protein